MGSSREAWLKRRDRVRGEKVGVSCSVCGGAARARSGEINVSYGFAAACCELKYAFVQICTACFRGPRASPRPGQRDVAHFGRPRQHQAALAPMQIEMPRRCVAPLEGLELYPKDSSDFTRRT